MYRPEGIIIDNTKLKLFEELNHILKEQKSVHIASAYFNIAGFQLVRDSFTDEHKLKLLLGTYPQMGEKEPDYFQPEIEYKSKMREDLEAEEFVKDKKETVLKLIELLHNDSWEVRLYNQGFLHGKTYIFDKLAIIGSSNFTFSGFTSNTELNAVLDEAHARYIKDEWFDKFWQVAIDFKGELLKILEESKFGTREYTPYEIFIKTLYELQKADISYEDTAIASLPVSQVDLTNFQEDAVKRVYSRLRNYHGALVADSVGLGKTWIAKKIIEDFGYYRRKRFLVVCPASVDSTLWQPAIQSIGLSSNILHQEELGRNDFDFDRLENRLNFKIKELELIVIDESHNFRNPMSNRYERLFTLIEKASINKNLKILMLTATPMNNTHWDLYFQLNLLFRNQRKLLFKDGIYDLEKQFELADKGILSPISDLMQIVSIRRTRQYIKDNYPDATFKNENGELEKIHFPERELYEINYSLDKTYQGLYHLIASEIENNLSLAYYKIEDYKLVGEKDLFKMGRMEALGAILKTILLKRLESSVEAFRKSIHKQISFFMTFKEYFNQGKILSKKQYDRYHLLFSEDNLQESTDNNLMSVLEEVKLEQYNVNNFNSDIDKDIEILKEIYDLIRPISQAQDSKLIELKNKLISLGDSGKILLFTFYADTAEYLYQALITDENMPRNYNKKISILTGSSTSEQRKKTIDRFQNGDIDLLISTDILSEGQNLQKAGIVINYDLHWNPVRMIQRAGRIDRIGSPFNTIYIYNFYPEQELESLLELVSILRNKIDNINSTIGLDSSVLGEAINPRVFGIIKKIKGTKDDKKEIVGVLEEEQFGGGELFWQPLKEFGFDRLKEFCESMPYGVQSGLQQEWGERNLLNVRGIFFYFQYSDDYHLWYLYDIVTNKCLTSKTEIINYISCKENEPRVIDSELDIFTIYNQVREIIKSEFSELKVVLSQSSTGNKEKVIADILEELNYLKVEEIISNEELKLKTDYIINWLNKGNLTKRRMQQIRRNFSDYKNTSNWQDLINNLSEFSREVLVIEVPDEIITYDENRLKLICVQYVS